jgi:hypothetical protein
MKWTSPRAPSRSGDFNSDIHLIRYQTRESVEFLIDRHCLARRRAAALGESSWIRRRDFYGVEGGDRAWGNDGAAG